MRAVNVRGGDRWQSVEKKQETGDRRQETGDRKWSENENGEGERGEGPFRSQRQVTSTLAELNRPLRLLSWRGPVVSKHHIHYISPRPAYALSLGECSGLSCTPQIPCYDGVNRILNGTLCRW